MLIENEKALLPAEVSRLSVEPKVRPCYKLSDLLAQFEVYAVQATDKAWDEALPVGREVA